MKNIKRVKPIICWMLVILWCGVIFSMSASTADESAAQSEGFIRALASAFSIELDSTIVESMHNVVRKCAHFAEYAVLGVLLSAAVGCHKHNWLSQAAIAFSAGAVYAVTDEIHQLFVPGRAGMLKDVLLDSLGVASGIAVAALIILIIGKFRAKINKN